MNQMEEAMRKAGIPTKKYNEGSRKNSEKYNVEDAKNSKQLLDKMTFIEKNEADSLFKEYISTDIEYFHNKEKKESNEKFFDKYPRALAYVFVEKDNKLTQLRKFYYVIERINRSLNLGMDVMSFKNELKLLVGHAWNKYDSNYVSKEFYDVLEKNVNAIKDNEDFKMFKQHFEAILCYIPKTKED